MDDKDTDIEYMSPNQNINIRALDEPSTDDDYNAADILVEQENLSNYDNLSERLEENKIDLHSLLFFCGGGIDEGENN